MKTSSRIKGFTLIELLVVIAIIGIITTIVMGSLNSSRAKGNDAKIKSQLGSLRNAAALYFDANGNYGTAFTTAACPTSGVNGTMFFETIFGMNKLTASSYYPGTPTVTCSAVAGTNPSYAVAVPLVDSAGSWCVDSSGAAKAVTVSPVINATTRLCN
jgi:prepilin-type N-terminal cleavage/methylation domain-containing protein